MNQYNPPSTKCPYCGRTDCGVSSPPYSHDPYWTFYCTCNGSRKEFKTDSSGNVVWDH